MKSPALFALVGLLGLGACSDDEDVFHLFNSTLPEARLGVAYHAQIGFQGGATPVGGLAVHGQLPPGIAFVDSLAFRLGGVPTDTGTYDFDVSGWCYGTNRPGQTDRKSYRIVVKP